MLDQHTSVTHAEIPGKEFLLAHSNSGAGPRGLLFNGNSVLFFPSFQKKLCPWTARIL